VKKRGQAAMEFLMTYGWAILAAVIVVGVLWYLLGNPANLAGNQFQASAPLVAKGLVISTSGITVNILNGAGDSILVTNVSLSSPVGTNVANCTSSGSTTPIGVGTEASFVLTCIGGLAKGDRINSDIVFTFRQGSSTFVQTSTGSVSGRVP
jgi:hypothetical protein